MHLLVSIGHYWPMDPVCRIDCFKLTPWFICTVINNTDRFTFDSSAFDYKSWSIVSTDTFHLVNWESPFNDAIQPIQSGAVMNRPSDGMIHVMLAGNDKVSLGSEMPGGGMSFLKKYLNNFL